MKHTIAGIANDHRVNALHLERFVQHFRRKYGIDNKNGESNTTTFFVNTIIEDFKKLPSEKYASPFIQDVDLFKLNVDGWTANDDQMSGSIDWTNPNYPDIMIYATPNWDEEGTIPFQLHTPEHEDGISVAELKLFKDSPIELQLEIYVSILKSIIKTL